MFILILQKCLSADYFLEKVLTKLRFEILSTFISSKENMDLLSKNPALGHITTFGGHPISCSAALATLNELQKSTIIKSINSKRNLFEKHLQHPKIKKIHGTGLMIALEFDNEEYCQNIVKE